MRRLHVHVSVKDHGTSVIPVERPATACCVPAAVEGTDAEKAFAFSRAFKELETRIKLLRSLPIGLLDSVTLQARLRQIGKSNTVPESV
jgi:hypothetical protein